MANTIARDGAYHKHPSDVRGWDDRYPFELKGHFAFTLAFTRRSSGACVTGNIYSVAVHYATIATHVRWASWVLQYRANLSEHCIAKLDCSEKNDMISSMINVWFRDEVIQKICQNLVESIPKRIREVIKNKGGHINYWTIIMVWIPWIHSQWRKTAVIYLVFGLICTVL